MIRQWIEAILILLSTILTWRESLKIHTLSVSIPINATSTPHLVRKEIPIDWDSLDSFSFMQISDIHISRYRKSGGLSHLNYFLSYVVPLVSPELVVVTGDLTDAKSKSTLLSAQHKVEWESYYSSLKASGVLTRRNGSFWLDQRGNHDCFNVESFASRINYFNSLSAVQKEGYHVSLVKDYGTYSFVAVDACPKFGYLDTFDMDALQFAIDLSIEQGHKHVFAMSHYPTATTTFGVSSQGRQFEDLANHVSLWLCGHLHKLFGGLGETMYAYQPQEFLELELGDLKSHGMYRIVVVDHDFVSFRDLELPLKLPIAMNSPLTSSLFLTSSGSDSQLKDVQSGFDPIVMITNPKDARYVLPGKEPLDLMHTSPHIRVFVWTVNTLVDWRIELDGSVLLSTPTYAGMGKAWAHIDSIDESEYLPLWLVPWDPLNLQGDVDHTLMISVTDDQGQTGSHTVHFRFDGTRNPEMESGSGGFIISLPLGFIIKDLTMVGYFVLTVGFLLIPKLFVLYLCSKEADCKGYFDWVSHIQKNLITINQSAQLYQDLVPADEKTYIDDLLHLWEDVIFTIQSTFLRFCELVRHDSLFYPLYLYMLYITVGPLLVGDFIPSAGGPVSWFWLTPDHDRNRYAWLMVYGLWFESGDWAPSIDTWLFTFHGLAYSTFPLVFYLSFCVTCPEWLYCSLNPRLRHPIHERWFVRTGVILVVLYQVLDTISLGLFYGLWALIVSPSRAWMLVWGCWALWVWRDGPAMNPLLSEQRYTSIRKSRRSKTHQSPSPEVSRTRRSRLSHSVKLDHDD